MEGARPDPRPRTRNLILGTEGTLCSEGTLCCTVPSRLRGREPSAACSLCSERASAPGGTPSNHIDAQCTKTTHQPAGKGRDRLRPARRCKFGILLELRDSVRRRVRGATAAGSRSQWNEVRLKERPARRGSWRAAEQSSSPATGCTRVGTDRASCPSGAPGTL